MIFWLLAGWEYQQPVLVSSGYNSHIGSACSVLALSNVSRPSKLFPNINLFGYLNLIFSEGGVGVGGEAGGMGGTNAYDELSEFYLSSLSTAD